MLYSGSDEQTRLNAIQTYLRYLSKKMVSSQEVPLAIALPMIQQIEEIEKQLRYLKNGAHSAAYAEMMNLGVEEIDTEGWTAVLNNAPSLTKIDSQEVAEELLRQIQKSEIKRNKKVPETVVKSITATTFWTLIDSLSIKWSKTKLKKKGINLEDYSTPGSPQNKVEITKKTR